MAPRRPEDTGRARDRVLYLLKTRGPQAARELAGVLGVTTMAVRQHLQALDAEGLIQFADERRKVGRPVRIWSLTSKASARFPDTHGELTVDLLSAVRATFGAEGLDRLVGERSRQQAESYRRRMPDRGAPLDQRISALATLRCEDGYMAECSRSEDGSWVLAENHCPICAAAAACQGLCRDELAMFSQLLGPDVVVSRDEHILAGARRCAYRIAAAAAPTN